MLNAPSSLPSCSLTDEPSFLQPISTQYTRHDVIKSFFITGVSLNNQMDKHKTFTRNKRTNVNMDMEVLQKS